MAFADYNRSAVWGGFPMQDLLSEPGKAFYDFDDLAHIDSTATTGKWVLTQVTSGTAVIIDGAGGLLKLDAGATTADQGVQLQWIKESVKYSATTPVYLETYITAITNPANQFFFGLSITDTSLFATGENSSTDHIGFEMNATSIAANANALQFVSESGGTRTTVADVHEIVASEGFFLGIRIERGTATAYVNGVPVGTITTNIPTTELAPTIALLAEGTTQPTATFDWIRVGNVLDRSLTTILAQ